MANNENNKYFYCWLCGAKTLNEKGYSKILMLSTQPPTEHKICYTCADRLNDPSLKKLFDIPEYRDKVVGILKDKGRTKCQS